ncbi:MAG: PDZ domain-containing protein [Bryobacteraceae bacterium]
MHVICCAISNDGKGIDFAEHAAAHGIRVQLGIGPEFALGAASRPYQPHLCPTMWGGHPLSYAGPALSKTAFQKLFDTGEPHTDKKEDMLGIAATAAFPRSRRLDDLVDAYVVNTYPATNQPGATASRCAARSVSVDLAARRAPSSPAGKLGLITECSFPSNGLSCLLHDTGCTLSVVELRRDFATAAAEQIDPDYVFHRGSLTEGGLQAIAPPGKERVQAPTATLRIRVVVPPVARSPVPDIADYRLTQVRLALAAERRTAPQWFWGIPYRICAKIWVLLLAASISSARSGPLLLRKPALSKTQIVFTFAGDLWSVPRQGGEARRLTAGRGIETSAAFSPDGSTIAFTAEYDGNLDVFTIPASGGVPRRLTYHPGRDDVVGWTQDGKRVLFRSHRAVPNDGNRLYTMPVEGGGLPDELPLPIAEDGSYSPDGSHIAYVPVFQVQAAWKKYRGGQTSKIWIANLEDSKVFPIPRENSNDFNPMWVGDRIYFLSDREGPVTLFYYDRKSRRVKRAIENHGLDFKSAAAGPGAIVYEQFGSLHLYGLKTGKTKEVSVTLAGDLPQLRQHYVNVATRLINADISPSGARAVFEARGEILTVPVNKGDPRNLTETPGVMERFPRWSPDGQSIAYLSDECGEYALHIRNQDGSIDVKKIPLGEKAFYSSPVWSPDGTKMAYLDNHSHLFYIDLEQKRPVLVDTDYYANGNGLAATWSPDSEWLAYSKTLKSHMQSIYLYSLASDKTTRVTDGLSDAENPAFDKNGKYLYFTASTNSGPAMEPDIESFWRPVTSTVYVLVLSKNEESPLAPESDEEKKKNDGNKEEAKRDDSNKDKDKDMTTEKVDVKVDLENIGLRILPLPMPALRYIGIATGKTGVVYANEGPQPGTQGPFAMTIHRFDLSKRKTDTILRGVRSFAVSFNGEKLLYQQGDKWTIADAPAPPGDGADAPPTKPGNEKTLKTADLKVKVDPAAEWKQMFHETWRIERDFFYDPHYHGLDLGEAEERYSAYLPGLASRDDLDYLFTEMLGHMTVGHMFLGGGDRPEVKRVPTGLLGADYKIESGRYRIAHVYNGENWNPSTKAPLTQPGVNVIAGDYILAVNGKELRASDNIYSFFEATADKTVLLKVGAEPTGVNSREVKVVPVDDESQLRHLEWIENNRRKVDEATNNRVAYVYMPDTGFGGYTSFTRYFFAQVDKVAVIIDGRFSHGGDLATDIIEYLQRKPMSVVTTRDGADLVQPQGAIFGPKVMVINQFAGSGGDAMPWYFRRAGVGKLIGERTWGGLVGLTRYPPLLDGGFVLAPDFAVWNPDGTFDVENRGVAPDIEVTLDPAAVRQGHDPQLEKAIEVVMEELKTNPPAQFTRPAYPDYR